MVGAFQQLDICTQTLKKTLQADTHVFRTAVVLAGTHITPMAMSDN